MLQLTQKEIQEIVESGQLQANEMHKTRIAYYQKAYGIQVKEGKEGKEGPVVEKNQEQRALDKKKKKNKRKKEAKKKKKMSQKQQDPL